MSDRTPGSKRNECGCSPTWQKPKPNGTCATCGGWLPGQRRDIMDVFRDGTPVSEPRVGTTKWRAGERVYWQDHETVWTVQPGPCSAGRQYVHITAPGLSAVVWQDEIVLASLSDRADRYAADLAAELGLPDAR